MALTTTENKLYIVELAPPFERLEIQFVPEGVSLSRTAEFAPLAVVGRNVPRRHFTGGESGLALQLDFYADSRRRDDVIQKVNWLESLTYADGGYGPARNVMLLWGDFLKNRIWVVKSIRANYSGFHSQFNMLPQQAIVDIQLDADSKKNPRINDIRR